MKQFIKRFGSIFVCLFMLGCIFSAAVSAESSDAASSTDESAPNVSMLTKMVITPFTSGAVSSLNSTTTYYKDFNVLERDFTAQTSYQLFSDTLGKVLDATGLCAGSGEMAERMQDCANNKPDEFATVANILEQYLEWQSVELQTLISLYETKVTSPLLHERLEARLVLNCIKEQMSTHDAQAALETCQEPSGWDISSILSMPCSGEGTITSSKWASVMESTSDNTTFKEAAANPEQLTAVPAFSYRYYAAKCVIAKQVQESLGAYQLVTLLPEFSIEILEDGAVSVKIEPPKVKPAEMYVVISQRIKQIILSDWFARDFMTESCIPSLFTPDNIADLELEQRRLYYSFCIPQRYISMLRKLPTDDYYFYAEALANRIAIVEMLELLNSAALVADEVSRTIGSVDKELGLLAKAHATYTKTFAKLYKDSIQLTSTKTVEDILVSIEEQFKVYVQSEAMKETHERQLAKDLVRMRRSLSTGITQ